MPSHDAISQRFAELEAAFSAIQYRAPGPNVIADHYATDQAAWCRWTASAASLIGGACGLGSTYFKTFDAMATGCHGGRRDLQRLFGVFQAAYEAYDKDLLFDLEIETAADVFGSFVAVAQQAMKENNKDVAAVIASAALEDALKRYAVRNGLNVDGKTMATVVNALKSKGLVSGAQKPLLDGMLKTRNSAMHADWDKITEPEVSSLTGFVEQFLLTNFSTSPHGKSLPPG